MQEPAQLCSSTQQCPNQCNDENETKIVIGLKEDKIENKNERLEIKNYKTKTRIYQSNEDQPLKQIKVSINRWIYGCGKTANKIKLASWNVNGIRSVFNKKQLNAFIYQQNPDMLCINQTKIDEQAYDKSPVIVHGYNNYFNFCKCSSGYSGVAVFSKYQPLNMIQDLPQKKHSQQGRVITLEFQKFYLVAVYVPSAGRNLQRIMYKTKQFEVSFHAHCQKLKLKKNVIICGDLNVSLNDIDVHRAKSTHKTPGYTDIERRSFRQFLNKGWIDTFRQLHPNQKQFTWWNIKFLGREKGIGRRLDFFLVNQSMQDCIHKANIYPEIKGSDHCPIDLEIDLSKLE